MIGTIRKHSKWLWVVIIAVTIITFVFWMNPGGRNGGGGATENYGSIDGQKVTANAFWTARNDVDLDYWFRTFQWLDRNPNFSEKDWQMEMYQRLFVIYEGKKLGIHVGDDAVATAARQILSSPTLEREFGLNGESVPLDTFVKNVLQPKGLTVGDFENFVRHELIMNQLRQAMGLAGALVTPQEMATMYQHEYQERSTQIVFFSASNYLSSVPVTSAAVGQFYTNYMAEYRLPERVVVSYVAFPVTNFMAEAKHQLTNLDDEVKAIYDRYGTNAVPEAKTPEEATTKIRDLLLRQQALVDARQQAYDFANDLFNMEPVRPENLATAAKQKGLAVRMTAPFDREYGPEEITNAPAFTTAAFSLTPDAPLGEPIAGPDAVYVIALDKQLPSEIPALGQIRNRVTQDYQFHEATSDAQAAGTNFVIKLQTGLVEGKTFPAICGSAGLHAETLPPFSLGTPDLPELGDRASLSAVKAATFQTKIGQASGFEPTDDGGFIVYVKSELPLDTNAMETNLPQFAAAFREQRENAAFINWFERTGSVALRNTPIAPGNSANPAP